MTVKVSENQAPKRNYISRGPLGINVLVTLIVQLIDITEHRKDILLDLSVQYINSGCAGSGSLIGVGSGQVSLLASLSY